LSITPTSSNKERPFGVGLRQHFMAESIPAHKYFINNHSLFYAIKPFTHDTNSEGKLA